MESCPSASPRYVTIDCLRATLSKPTVPEAAPADSVEIWPSRVRLWGFAPPVTRPSHGSRSVSGELISLAQLSLCGLSHDAVRHRAGVVAPPASPRHRTRSLETSELRVHRGMPITAPARTLLDLAATLPERPLERALDEAVVRRLLREADLAATWRRLTRHPEAVAATLGRELAG